MALLVHHFVPRMASVQIPFQGFMMALRSINKQNSPSDGRRAIEQVQKLLGHVKIDTTMHYAMVNQSNVKISHRKYIN